MSEAVNQAIDLAMAEDPDVFLIGEDIEDPIGGVMKGTKGLSTKYGRERVRNTPISEQAIVGTAIGASLVGMRPIAEVMLMDFFAVAMDQVANHAAKLRYMSGGRTNVPITIRTSVGGGRQFGAQHSQSLEAWMMHIPGLKVVVPSTPRDAKGLLWSCIFDDDPCIFMETMSLLFTRGPVPPGRFEIPLGVAEVKREGDDVTVVTWGWQVPEAMAAAETVAGEGISVEVIDVRTLVPLDTEAILASGPVPAGSSSCTRPHSSPVQEPRSPRWCRTSCSVSSRLPSSGWGRCIRRFPTRPGWRGGTTPSGPGSPRGSGLWSAAAEG